MCGSRQIPRKTIVVKENSINSAATGKGKKKRKKEPDIRDEVSINGIVYY